MDRALHPFFVMPLYDDSIKSLIGIDDPDDCFSVIVKILDGVEASHLLNVIHRDLKPENILFLIDDKGEHQIVITDYGIAKFAQDDLFTAVETGNADRLANFQYAAPEQREREGVIGKATDIYSLGLICNQLFTGKIANGTEYETIGESYEAYGYLDDIVNKMLKQNPEHRYQDIREIRHDISQAGREYISGLKLSKLNETVISEEEVDDSIESEPTKLIGADWDDGTLKLKLNRQVNSIWIDEFVNLGSFTSLQGKEPGIFTFKGNEASVTTANESGSNKVIGHFKEWLPKVDQLYLSKLRKDIDDEKKRKIAALAKKRPKKKRKC